MTKDYNVFRTGGKWAAKLQGAERASSLHRTQREAYEAARNYADNAGGGEISTHRADNGQIRQKNTIGKRDPFPPRG